MAPGLVPDLPACSWPLAAADLAAYGVLTWSGPAARSWPLTAADRALTASGLVLVLLPAPGRWLPLIGHWRRRDLLPGPLPAPHRRFLTAGCCWAVARGSWPGAGAAAARS